MIAPDSDNPFASFDDVESDYPEGEPWFEQLTRIEEMLEDTQYQWAEETLEGIRDWIREHKHVTPKQIEAIDNIESSVEEGFRDE